jgi:hypothetical protein
MALVQPFKALDTLRLPAGSAIGFVDAATGGLIEGGLRCELLLRGSGLSLGVARCTPGGFHHWPELSPRWRSPAPSPLLADVLVRDPLGRFLPLSLPWPLPSAPGGQVEAVSVVGDATLLRVQLHSAPQRPTPPGLAAVVGQLIWQPTGQPAAWARVLLTDAQGHARPGGCDAEGRLALHLPLPRPPRAAEPIGPSLSVFFDPALATSARRLGAPDVLALAAQPAVLALARFGETDPYGPGALSTVEPAVLRTLDLIPARSELRLVPAP